VAAVADAMVWKRSSPISSVLLFFLGGGEGTFALLPAAIEGSFALAK